MLRSVGAPATPSSARAFAPSATAPPRQAISWPQKLHEPCRGLDPLVPCFLGRVRQTLESFKEEIRSLLQLPLAEQTRPQQDPRLCQLDWVRRERLLALAEVTAGALFSGSAYVFVRSGTTWTEQAKLTASDAAALDKLGSSVALSGDTALVGAIFGDGAVAGSGSAYVFVRSGTTWSQQAKLTASDAAVSDSFGESVALSEDTALVGASGDDDAGTHSGSAYVFVRSGTTWSQQAKLAASELRKAQLRATPPLDRTSQSRSTANSNPVSTTSGEGH